MDAKSELENLMPDSLTKWIWWSSIGLPVILYGVYPDLPKSWLPQIEEVRFLTRLLLSGLIPLLGFGSLVILLARHDKKIRLQNAELKFALDAVSTDAQGNAKSNKTLQSLMAANAQELDTLKKSHAELERIANERKFLLEVSEKKLAAQSKSDTPQRSFSGPKIPTEPASASSEPGPEDYHAPRRSFFHSDSDRPKRR